MSFFWLESLEVSGEGSKSQVLDLLVAVVALQGWAPCRHPLRVAAPPRVRAGGYFRRVTILRPVS